MIGQQYTAQQMVQTFTPNLTKHEYEANLKYFEMVLRQLPEGGIYVYPAMMKTFTKTGDKFIEN